MHSELGDLLLWLEKRQGENLFGGGFDQPLPEARDERIEIDEHDVAPEMQQRVARGSSERFDHALVARLRILRSETALRAEVREERSETSHFFFFRSRSSDDTNFADASALDSSLYSLSTLLEAWRSTCRTWSSVAPSCSK